MMRHYRRLFVSVLCVCYTSIAAPALAQVADCGAAKSFSKRDSFGISPKDQYQCERRGFDPNPELKENEGKNAGINTEGAAGFSYGTISAPESPAAARRANASVSKKVLESVCSFPPKVKVGWPPSITLSGSCLDFMNGTFKPKDKLPPPASLPGINANETCPAESDSAGMYGTKKPIAAGGAFATECGGMVPTADTQLVLNANANRIAVMDNGKYAIKIYTKSGGQFNLTQHVALPSYLCTLLGYDDTQIWQKSMDLTPPIGQMITFNEGSGALAIKLQSRAAMGDYYEPPYDENAPELYLALPIDGAGNVLVPNQASCPDQAVYAQPYVSTGARQEILVQPAIDPACESVSVGPTSYNDPIVLTCNANSTLDAAQNKCFDIDTSAQTPAQTVQDNWVGVCPSDPAYNGPKTINAPHLPLATGACPACTCPQSAGMPASTASMCPGNPPTAPVNGTCAGMPATPPELGSFPVESSCGSSNASCDLVTIPTKSAACSGQPAFTTQKLQYGVLNRPNIHYPEGSNAVLDKVTGGAASATTPAAMAHTVAGMRFYTLPQTIFSLEQSAPAITLNEGGILKLKNNSTLIMNPSATINPGGGIITMNGGGELVSPGGVQLQSFPDGGTYAPGALLQFPVTVNVSRSTTLPAGFIIPTMPTTAAKPAYMRMPAEPLPE